MKWMFVGLAASGALVYALIFLAQSQHEPVAAQAGPGPTSVDLAESLVEEIDESATAGSEEVDSSATLPGPALSNPVTPRPEPAWADNAWAAGVRFFEERDYEQAADAIEVAVGEREDSAYRHYLLGLTYLKLGEPEGAVEELTRSLELNGGNVRTQVNLSRAHIAMEDLDAARDAVDLALETNVDDVDAWNVLGRIELGQGHLEEAEAAFTKAVERDPDHAYAWNNLGYARIQQGRYQEALHPLLAATQSGKEVGYFFNNLGVVLERLDDLTGASEAFAKAESLGSENALASLARVDSVLLARGDAPEETESEPEVTALNQ